MLVEIAGLAHPIVSLIDSVGEVGKDDGDMYSAALFVVERRIGLGLRITGADCDAIVESLQPSCHKLSVDVSPVCTDHEVERDKV